MRHGQSVGEKVEVTQGTSWEIPVFWAVNVITAMINGSNSYFICIQRDTSNQMSLVQVIFPLISIFSKFSSEQ